MDLIHIPLGDCALKFSGQSGAFDGYGSVFGVKDTHGDIVMPGAYADVLKSGDRVKLYANHGWMRGALPVGMWDSLAEDAKGLHGSASLTMQMPSAADAYWSVKGGLVSGLSVAILTHKSDVERTADGSRLIHRVRMLKEISIVDTPANPLAQVETIKGANVLEAIEDACTIREIEQLLRDAAGLSKGAAAALVARVKSIALPGDPAASLADDMQAQALANRIKRLAGAT